MVEENEYPRLLGPCHRHWWKGRAMARVEHSSRIVNERIEGLLKILKVEFRIENLECLALNC